MTIGPTDPPVPGDFARESSRIGINLIALVAARFATLAMTLVQMGIIFRQLEVGGAGQFVFAFGYASLFTVFATLGIQRLLVRDIARDPAIAWTYVWTATAVVAVLSLFVFAFIAGSIYLIEPNPTIRAAVMLAALAFVVLWALQCPFEALITARERMVFLGIVYLVTGALKLIGIALLLSRMPSSAAAHGIIAVAHLAGFLLCAAFAIHVAGWERPRLRLALAFNQVRECFPFMLAMVCSQIYFKSDMSILKFMRGETAAGIYGPAQRLVEPIMMLASVWGFVVFPALCRFSVNAPEHYARLKKTSIRLALLVAFPMAVGIACLATPIVALLAGPGYAESAIVLRLLCVVIPLFYLNGIGQEFFYAANRNWFVVITYALAAVLNVAVNLLAIPHLGVMGVAIAAIAANLLITVLFVWGLHHEFGAMGLPALLAKTVLACTLMGLIVYPLAGSGPRLILGILAGALVYMLLQFVLRVLAPDERRLVARMLKAPLRRLSL